MNAAHHASSRPRSFAGLQPEWAGEEPSVAVDPQTLFAGLRRETVARQLIDRGYAVVDLDSDTIKTYDEFYSALRLFCSRPEAEKIKFAQMANGTKMDDSMFTPNQFHGYSQMQGLKEQFMIRSSGHGVQLYMPGCQEGGRLHFGALALQLYQQLDQLSRRCLEQVARDLRLPERNVSRILDPVHKLEPDVQVAETELGARCTTGYVYDNYISSSILDVFHYFNTFKKEDASDERFHNNHASHTDSGIVTVVPVADEAGLDVYDQKLQQWISLEQVIHAAVPGKHRHYATIFFGDSCEYLSRTGTKPLFHRVARCSGERYSIVFKMRTFPARTAFRYQEDYPLALQQARAIEAYEKTRPQVGYWVAASALAALIVVGLVAIARAPRSSSQA